METRIPSPDRRAPSLVVVRSTTVDPAVLVEVSGPHLVEATDTAVRRRARLREESERLGEVLHEQIGALAPVDKELKAPLVSVRRAVHRMAAPPRHVWTETVREVLAPGVPARIDAWVEGLTASAREVEALDARYAADHARAAEALRRACEDPWFRHALAVASPPLSGVLDRWLAEPERVPRRRSLVALSRYLARAATKTSPFSSFNLVAGGHLVDASGTYDVDPATGRAVLEVDPLAWQLTLQSVVPLAAAGLTVPLVVNPTAEVDGDHYHYLGPLWDERWLTAPRSRGIDACLEAVDRCGDAGLPGVADELAEAAGVGQGEAAAFTARLLGAGLVHAEVPSPPSDLGEKAASRLLPGVDRAAPEVREAVALLDAHLGRRRGPEAAVADRTAVTRGLAALAEAAGVPDRGPATRPTVHDNFVADPGDAGVPVESWGPALADLDAVLAWLPLHDPLLGYRIAVGELFRLTRDAGEEVPLLDLHRDLARIAGGTEDAFAGLRPFLSPDHVGCEGLLEASGVERLVELARLRRGWCAALPSGEEGDEPVSWPSGALARQRAEAPAYVTAPDSVTCYVQPVSRRPGTGLGGTGLVLNTVHGGGGRGRSRWTHLVGAGAPDILAPGPGDHEQVELDGAWGSALNLRSPTTRRAVEYPGCPRSRSAADTIRLADLTVSPDERTGLLRLRERGGPTLSVVHGGMMSEAFAPSLARLLIGGFGTSYLQHAAHPVVPAPRPTAEGEVGRRARVDVGRVTLARAAWAFPGDRVPARAGGEGDGRYLVRLGTWALDLGLPSRFFVRVAAEPSSSDRLDKERKPTYVDLRQVALVRVWERIVASLTPSQWLLVEEAHPCPGDAGGPGALEVVLERAVGRIPDTAH